MSLVVIARNISELADVSDYDVEVSVNQTRFIFSGIVRGHYRADGAGKLLHMIADEMESRRTNLVVEKNSPAHEKEVDACQDFCSEKQSECCGVS